MEKWFRGEIALGFYIATVLWLGVLGWQAAYAPTDLEKNKCQQAAEKSGHKTEECKSLWERTTSDPVAFFTFVLSISTIGLWIVTWRSGVRQTRDMEGAIAAAEEANKLNRENFASNQRPWIKASVSIAGDYVCNGHTGQVPLTIALENIGRSPAFCVHPFVMTYPGAEGGSLLAAYAKLSKNMASQPINISGYGATIYPNEPPVSASASPVSPLGFARTSNWALRQAVLTTLALASVFASITCRLTPSSTTRPDSSLC